MVYPIVYCYLNAKMLKHKMRPLFIVVLAGMIFTGCTATQSQTTKLQTHNSMPAVTDIAWAKNIQEQRDMAGQQSGSGNSASLIGNAKNTRSKAFKAPTPEEVAWANKILELAWEQSQLIKTKDDLAKERQMNYRRMIQMIHQQNELQDIISQVDKIKVEARAENRLEEQFAEYLAKNKAQLMDNWTKQFTLNKQERFDALQTGYSGYISDYWVDDVRIEGKSILAFSECFRWTKSNGGGGLTRVEVGWDVNNYQSVGHKILNTREFSPAESINSENNIRVYVAQEPTQQANVSPWMPDNETIQRAYQEAEDVTSELCIHVLEHLADKWMDEADPIF